MKITSSKRKLCKRLELTFKLVLGVRKVKMGKMFDEFGFAQDSQEKITRYVVCFLQYYQKSKNLIDTKKFYGKIGENNNLIIIYTMKTTYKLFGILVFWKTSHFTRQPFCFETVLGNVEFCNLGKYIATNPDIDKEILLLIQGLEAENQNWVLRQIAHAKYAYENNSIIATLTLEEIKELERIYCEFYPNILELSKNLYYYNGYFLPIKAFIASVFFHKHCIQDIFNEKTLQKIQNKDFIDVGGFIGDSAIVFEREFCNKNIYSFEPTKENYELTKKTIELNNSSRIIPINKGLGAEQTMLQINTRGGGSSSIKFITTNEMETIEMTTLDIFVKEHKLLVGFIKVDIEGFEMEFLKGAKETICTQKPAMVISIYHSGKDYFYIKPLIESWNLGYKFTIYKRVDGSSLTVDTSLFCECLD